MTKSKNITKNQEKKKKRKPICKGMYKFPFQMISINISNKIKHTTTNISKIHLLLMIVFNIDVADIDLHNYLHLDYNLFVVGSYMFVD